MRILVVMLILSIAPAWGHSQYDQYCCGGKDCHEVNAEDVVENSDGSWTYLPDNITFDRSMVRPSFNGKFHVCILPDESGAVTMPRCIYVLQGS